MRTGSPDLNVKPILIDSLPTGVANATATRRAQSTNTSYRHARGAWRSRCLTPSPPRREVRRLKLSVGQIHKLDAPVLLPALGSTVVSHRIALAEARCLEP